MICVGPQIVQKPVALSNIPCGHFGYRSCNKISYLNIITLWTLDLATEFAAICREFPYLKPYSLSSSYISNTLVRWDLSVQKIRKPIYLK